MRDLVLWAASRLAGQIGLKETCVWPLVCLGGFFFFKGPRKSEPSVTALCLQRAGGGLGGGD